MSDKNNSVGEKTTPMPWVITCGDEGVQINHGRRLAFVGAGLRLEGFSKALAALRKTLASYGSDLDTKLRLAANEENAYVKTVFNLNDFDETNASMQQHAEAMADREGMLYVGILPFADPLELKHEIKGHMVRPKGIHIANKICLSIAGGETTYNLGRYLISADWVGLADPKLAKQVLEAQIKFYESLSGKTLPIIIEEEGDLAEELIEKNKAVLVKLGLYQPTS